MKRPAEQSASPASRPTQRREIKIETRNLSVYYGNQVGIKDVTLQVYKGEVLACIGPSGCGKSTFLRCLNRMNDEIPVARVEGTVLLDGQDIYAPGVDLADLRRRVGMVFQRPNPFPMSVFDNVAYGPRIYGIRDRDLLEQIVEESLRAAALWDDLDGDVHKSALELSGGQQQRLCIARALALSPEVLLMDEPCSALDPAATFQIEELIVALKHEYTIVIVTHNMFQASRVSDRTAFFHLGEMVELGPTEQIFERPQDPRTDAYIRGKFG